MSFYDYGCDECKIVWEIECPIGTAPKKKKCPECDTKSERYYGEPPTLIFKGRDFHTVRSRDAKAALKTNQEDGDNFLKASIKASKGAIDTAKKGDYYARYTPNEGTMEKAGFRKMNSQERTDASAKAKTLVGKEASKFKK